jgi:hypothetical protein
MLWCFGNIPLFMMIHTYHHENITCTILFVICTCAILLVLPFAFLKNTNVFSPSPFTLVAHYKYILVFGALAFQLSSLCAFSIYCSHNLFVTLESLMWCYVMLCFLHQKGSVALSSLLPTLIGHYTYILTFRAPTFQSFSLCAFSICYYHNLFLTFDHFVWCCAMVCILCQKGSIMFSPLPR